MANQKISQLPSGTAGQTGDLVPIARSGNNFSIDPTQLVSLNVNTSGSGLQANGRTNGALTANAGLYAWTSAASILTGSVDTGLSRTAAGVVAVGNGTQGDSSGELDAAKVKINGTLMSNAPVLVWTPYITGAVGTSGAANNWGVIIPASGITVTRVIITFTSNTLSGYSTAPQVRVTDGTTPILVNLTNVSFVDSGVISQNYAAGATIHVDTIAGVGGSGTASGMVVSVQYRMQ